MLYFLVSVEGSGKVHAWCLSADPDLPEQVGATAAENWPNIIQMLVEVPADQLKPFEEK